MIVEAVKAKDLIEIFNIESFSKINIS